ncbi:MAG TPA: YfhO family protein [Gemmatimonadales bacterium]|nr:YfhO family protein [Gemmatimonadales bacterium]
MYEPRRPTLAAAGLMALWVAVLAPPMLEGKWLAGPWSDQYAAGFAFRQWGAEWWTRLGHVPLWNPEMFGGLPFVAAGHGDIFYPTSFLRLVLPVATVVNLGFVVHYILAGLFTYWLLRRLSVSWTGAVIGGLAYELSGLLASYPSPGHDGKLFASTALPLAFLALVLALRDKRPEGYGLLAIAIALGLLGHFQIAYYLLIAIGLFALYLTLEENTSDAPARRFGRLGIALAAALLAFGLAAIQVLPFFSYIPFSPRAAGYYGFAGSTSYAIPWSHVPEFFLKNFVGSRETYWGSNPLKLHSEYLGLPVVALAVLGAAVKERRRLVVWVGGIGLLFLLISLGASTPFYKLWWTVMPLVSKTRAPGMAFFIVAFVVALLAGLGAQRLERKEGGKGVVPWLILAGVVALLAVSGVFGAIAEALAGARAPAARDNASAIMWGSFGSALALGLTSALAWATLRDRLTPRLFALALALVIGGDLWLNATRFWTYSPNPTSDIFRPDQLTDRIRATPLPYRVLDLGVYPSDGVTLMAFDIPQVLGHHGNELRYYDELLGGKNEWNNLRFVHLWDLLAVRYALTPSGARNADSIPGYRRVLDSVPTSAGGRANLFERIDVQPYARVVPGGFKAPDSSVVIPTLLDPRIDYSRVVLFTPDQPVTPIPIREMPPPSPSRARVTTWVPGRMTIALDPAPPQPSYVLVSENWYPDWHATVDGAPASVLRGDYTLITVPVSAGAKRVELSFRSRDYETGRAISLGSLVLVTGVVVGSLVRRRRNA